MQPTGYQLDNGFPAQIRLHRETVKGLCIRRLHSAYLRSGSRSPAGVWQISDRSVAGLMGKWGRSVFMVGICNGNRPYTPFSVAGPHTLFRLAALRAPTCDRLG